MNLFTTDSNSRFFIAIITGFCLATLLIFVFLENTAEMMMRQSDNKQYSDLMSSNGKIAIIGTSHTETSLSHLLKLKEIVNLSGGYTLPTVMYFKMKRTVEHLPDLKVVYLEADTHLFYYGPLYSGRKDINKWSVFFDASSENDLGELYAVDIPDYYSLQNDIAPILLKRIMGNIVDGISDYFSNRKVEATLCNDKEWHAYIDKKKTSSVSNSITWNDFPDEYRESEIKSRIRGFGLSGDALLDKNMVEYYRKTIELAKKNNITVRLIRNPLPDEFSSKVPEKIVTDVYNLLHQLVDEYDLKFLDYSKIFIDTTGVFDNQDHLNNVGSIKISNLIRDDYCKSVK